MHQKLAPAEVRDMFKAVAARMIANVDLLTTVDQAIGDGDHGIGMRRGFAAVAEQMEVVDPKSVPALFKAVGMAILSKTGGAAGAVFGTLFRSGGGALAEADFDADGLVAFLDKGLEDVQKRGGSKPGQKTMIDALVPAVEAARKATGQGLAASLAAAAEGAARGVEDTKNMIATTGKARTLGERSLGHPDPGAVSIRLILEAMRDYAA